MGNIITALLVLLMMPVFSYAGSAGDKGTNAGNNFLTTYGSKEGIRALSNPLISGNSPMTTINGSTSFNGQLLCPSSKSFIEIQITVSSYNDLSSVTVTQDMNMDGSGDFICSVPFWVSGVCGNGVISCNPGTWNTCSFYKWTADKKARISLEPVSFNELRGCYCINDSCSYNASSHLDKILKTLGSGAAGAVQSRDPRYSITRTSIKGSQITYYGQDADSCSSVSSSYGSDTPEQYYANPERMAADTTAEAAHQKQDPQSYYSLMFNSRAWEKRNLEDSYIDCTVERTGSVLQKENLCAEPEPEGWLGGHEETESYRIQFFHNWEVNDCNCYETPGIDPALCLSPPSAADTGSPPYGSEFIGKGCEYHARSEKDGKDACLTTKYDYYDLCKRYSDVFEVNKSDSCSALEDNCLLYEEAVDGVKTYKDYNPTGEYPEPSCKTFAGAYGTYDICKKWWKQKRTYHCKKQGDTYDFSDAHKRMDVITNSVTDNTSHVYYEDYRKEGEQWSDSSHTVSLPKRDSYATCEKACTVRIPKQDTQAGQSGHTGQYRKNTDSYAYFLRSCSPAGMCPLEPDEELVEDCHCPDDFNEAAALMEALNQAGKDMTCDGQWTEGACTGTIHIFGGEVKKCRNPGIETGFYDCCEVKEGCDKEDQETALARDKGLVQEVGEYCKEECETPPYPLELCLAMPCLQEVKVFCVFHSQLGRIIQQQGRPQLKSFGLYGGWGIPENPTCRGFTPEEFQMLDFSQMNLSEFYAEIKTRAQSDIETEMKDRVKDFYDDIK
jgi:hypothetical protein